MLGGAREQGVSRDESTGRPHHTHGLEDCPYKAAATRPPHANPDPRPEGIQLLVSTKDGHPPRPAHRRLDQKTEGSVPASLPACIP